jgi:hypothetical protein
MYIFDWFAGRFSIRAKAIALYKRGMARAKKRDHQGAILDYTSTIGLAEAPADVRAMALYNRALEHVAAGDDEKGFEDLVAVLAMDEMLVNPKTMARQELARMDRRPSDTSL